MTTFLTTFLLALITILLFCVWGAILLVAEELRRLRVIAERNHWR